MRWRRRRRERDWDRRDVSDTGELQVIVDAAALTSELAPLVARLEGHSTALQAEVDRLKRLTDPVTRQTRRTGNGYSR